MMKYLFFFLFSLSLNAESLRVYLGSGADGIYSTFLDTEKGTLTEAEKLVENPGSGFLVKGKNGVLYSTSKKFKKEGGVAAFKIGKDGGLTLLNYRATGSPGICHVSLDQTEKVLLCAHYSGGSAGSFLLEEDGSISSNRDLKEHDGSSINARQKKPHPHSIYTGPDNKFAYVPDLGTDEVWIYTVNLETGILTLVDKAEHPMGGGPRHMKFGKDGRQAYVLSELTLETVVYDRDTETGKLTKRFVANNLEEGKDKSEMTSSEIRVSPDGKFLYAANRDLANRKRDSISVFSVKENGDIRLIQEIPAEAWIPRNLNLSPDGKWLLVAGQKSNLVTLFSIDLETGKLTYTNQKISVPSPMCVEF